MADISTLVRQIKQAAIDAVNENCPCEVIFGVVRSEQPLEINVEQKLTLGEDQLILCRGVVDYETYVTVSWETEKESGGSGYAAFAEHSHNISGKKKILVHNALKTGEKVVLLRVQGGQKYLVLDRVGDA